MLDELSDNSFLRHVSEASDTDPDLIHFIECHLKDTVPRQTINLPVAVYLSTKDWTTVLRGHVQATRNDYTKLHRELELFEVVLVPVLKGSNGAPIML